MNIEFVNRLINARKDKNWTQADLAKALNLNLKNVQRWEQGSSKPSFEAATQLAVVLEVSLDYLAGITHKPQAAANNQLLQAVEQLPAHKQMALLELIS